MNATTQLSGVSSPFSLRAASLLLRDIVILPSFGNFPLDLGRNYAPARASCFAMSDRLGKSVALKTKPLIASGSLNSALPLIDPRPDVERTIFDLDAIRLAL